MRKKRKFAHEPTEFIDMWNNMFLEKYYSKRGFKESEKGFG